MSNVVPLKVWSNYKVSINRSTDYTFTVLACSTEDAKHMVMRALDEQDMELTKDMMTWKGPTYTNVLEVTE